MTKITLSQLVGTPIEGVSKKTGKAYKIFQGLYTVDGKPNTLLKTFFEPVIGEEYEVEITTGQNGELTASKAKSGFSGGGRSYGRDYDKEYDYNSPSFALSYAKDLANNAGKSDAETTIAEANKLLAWLKANKPTGAVLPSPGTYTSNKEKAVDNAAVQTSDGEIDLSDLPF